MDDDMIGISCMKTFLTAFNFIIWIIGMVLVVLGIWAELELHKYLELPPELSSTGPLVIIGIGGLIVTISSIAINCILKGQPAMLNFYGGFLLCVFAMMAGVCSCIVCYNLTLEIGLLKGLARTVMNDNPEKINIDNLQSTFHCCGAWNYTDWIILSPRRVIPASCCIDPQQCVTANYSDVFQLGCYDAVILFLAANTGRIIIAVVSIGLCVLSGMTLSWLLASAVSYYNCADETY